MTLSNESDWAMKKFSLGWRIETWRDRVANALGYRYLDFGAGLSVLDGRVSAISYGIAAERAAPRPLGNIICVKSVHGFWAERKYPFLVDSVDDESPQYRVKGSDKYLSVTYTSDASPDLTTHAFQLDLSCFWGLHECRTVSRIAPLLWQDKATFEKATDSRLRGSHPCPDRVLAGRARYLLDINILLLEVIHSRREKVNEEGDYRDEIITDYRLKETIRGYSVGNSFDEVRWRRLIRAPRGPFQQMANPISPLLKPGDKVLFFGGEYFDSCRFVPATPTALDAVRTPPAPKRVEDQVMIGKLL